VAFLLMIVLSLLALGTRRCRCRLLHSCCWFAGRRSGYIAPERATVRRDCGANLAAVIGASMQTGVSLRGAGGRARSRDQTCCAATWPVVTTLLVTPHWPPAARRSMRLAVATALTRPFPASCRLAERTLAGRVFNYFTWGGYLCIGCGRTDGLHRRADRLLRRTSP
jgi:hypothetical protein